MAGENGDGNEKAGELEKTDHQELTDVIKARYAAGQADKSLKHVQRWTRSIASILVAVIFEPDVFKML
jgi:hypothetical protein